MRTTLRWSALAALAIPLSAADSGKPRVYLSESQALEVSGDALAGDSKGSFSFRGGTSPRSIEVMKHLSRRCPAVVVTSNPEKADYVVRFDHEEASPITPFTRGNKVAIFDKSQELVFSGSTRFLSNAVKDACGAIERHARR